MEIICPNGLKGDVRPGLSDNVIRLGLKAQRGRDTTGPYNAHSPNKGKRNEKYKEKKWELMKKRTNNQDYSSRSGIHGFPTGL